MKPCIILVEDDDALRKLLELMLIDAGYHVLTASNGREAMQIAEVRDIDLLITDLVMPEQEGVETIIRIRRKRPGLPIIAMSGAGDARAGTYLKIAGNLGANLLLAKPFEHVNLIRAIDGLLSASNACAGSGEHAVAGVGPASEMARTRRT
jgi:DNA-binding response OmpR family regulator